MRRVLFFPGHRILAYEWDRGHFRRVEAFEPDDTGRAAFRAWLEEAPRTPVQLLLDVIEEEFHVDHVPHVIGRDRMELYRRTAQKHFRNTEFRYITAQDRQESGRRDDRVLIAGLTNPELLKVWLTVIDTARVPLKGIHSLPLVGERLLPHLGASRTRRALVISQQIPSTLRQSYYENGRLRFSRLAPGRYRDAVGFVDFLWRELDQTLHFLETQRFRRRDDPVDVFVIAGQDVAPALRDNLASSDSVTCHLVPLEGLAARVGIRGELPGGFADSVFVQVLLKQWRPANHYGLARLRRHFFVQRGRQALRWTAAALVLVAAAVVGGTVLQGRVYEQGAREARARAAGFEEMYQQRLRQLAEFDYRAVDVKSAVDLMNRLDAAATREPGGMMARVGEVLDRHPDIVLDGLTWLLSSRPDLEPEPGGDALTAAPAADLPAIAVADAPAYQYALIEGDVVGFGSDYRRAVEIFERFVAGLDEGTAFGRIEVLEAPFDLRPDSGVSGDSGTGARDRTAQRASFSVRLRLDDGEGDGEA